MLLVFLAQLVLVLTPIIEGREGPDARAHVEQAGTRIHHAHDEADCSACTARQLLASTEVLPPTSMHLVVAANTVVGEKFESFSEVSASTTRSRAPPTQI
jgi:hypothetical protein